MADVLSIVILRRRQRLRNIRREWMLRDRENPFELSEQAFRSIYRLPRCAVRNLCEEIKDFLSAANRGYSVEMQVLSCLQVLGSGSFQNTTGGLAFLQMSQSTVSRNMDRFLDAIMNLTEKYIQFSTDSSDLLKTKQEFYEYSQFPNVIGAIDCTHVYICRPATDDWFSYLDRKSRFSLNIQMIS